jgi:hypothetical protein
MDKKGAQWMSAEEVAQWNGAQPAEQSAPAKTAKASKSSAPTVARLNAMLLAAASSGDVSGARSALDQGADPNTRARANPQESAVGVALSGCHAETALVILQAGGLVAPYVWGRQTPNTFLQDAAEKKPALIDATMSAFVQGSSKWDVIIQARETLGSTAELTSLAAQTATLGKFSLTRQAFDAGVDLKPFWAAVEPIFTHSTRKLSDVEERQALLGLLAQPLAVQSISELAAMRLYRAAAHHDDVEFLKAMLGAGLRPSVDWSVDTKDWTWAGYLNVKRPEEDSPRSNLLTLAAAADGGAAFNFLKTVKPVVQAAKARLDSPWMLKDISVGRLVELRALGVGIEELDATGRSLLHIWAASDNGVRAGWATLAKEAPELFAKLDAQGHTATDRMAARLKSDARPAFLASLSRIEGREIRREASKPAPKAKGSSSTRL